MLKNQKEKIIYLSLSILTLFMSCLSSKNATTTSTATTHDKYSKEYYNNLSSNKERIIELLSGTFVHRFKDPDVPEFTVWKVNDNMDSIIIHMIRVGNPNKDGYWIYRSQFMTHLPNEPFNSSLQKIESISRDTFKTVTYIPVKQYSIEEVLDPNFSKTVVLNGLKSANQEVTYVQNPKDRTNFKGTSNLIDIPKNMKKQQKYIQEVYNISPVGMEVEVHLFDTKEDSVYTDKLETTNQLQRTTYYKNHKK